MSAIDDALEVENSTPPVPGIVNEGRHTVRVSSISRGPSPWGGEMRLSLRLACDEAEGAAPIFVDVPFNNDRRLGAVAAALGTDAETLVEGDLRPFAGQQLEAVVGHYKKRSGSTAAGIKVFLPKTADEPAVNTATEQPPAINAQLPFSDALVEAVAQRVIALLAAKDAPPRRATRAAPKRDPRSQAVKVVDALADDDDIPF
jgi:hypothetical protein